MSKRLIGTYLESGSIDSSTHHILKIPEQSAWAYIAGFFDGEGHVALAQSSKSNRRAALCCNLYQAKKEGRLILEAIQRFLCARNISCSVLASRQNEMYTLTLRGWNNALNFLKGVYPYLSVKRVVSLDIIRYSSAFPRINPGTRIFLCCESKKNTYLGVKNISDILKFHGEGLSNCAIARRYGIDDSTVSRIVNRKRSRMFYAGQAGRPLA
jgi:hypothetical protein